jgi:hypothetical protein
MEITLYTNNNWWSEEFSYKYQTCIEKTLSGLFGGYLNSYNVLETPFGPGIVSSKWDDVFMEKFPCVDIRPRPNGSFLLDDSVLLLSAIDAKGMAWKQIISLTDFDLVDIVIKEFFENIIYAHN